VDAWVGTGTARQRLGRDDVHRDRVVLDRRIDADHPAFDGGVVSVDRCLLAELDAPGQGLRDAEDRVQPAGSCRDRT
jgi:hypothetical protein